MFELALLATPLAKAAGQSVENPTKVALGIQCGKGNASTIQSGVWGPIESNEIDEYIKLVAVGVGFHITKFDFDWGKSSLGKI